jgi:hypothetical protein
VDSNTRSSQVQTHTSPPESTLIDLLNLEETTQPQRPAASQSPTSTDLLGGIRSNNEAPQRLSNFDLHTHVPDEEDGWGDFEDVAVVAARSMTQNPAPTSFKSSNIVHQTERVAAPAPEEPPDDDWDAFEDGEPASATQPSPKRATADPKPSTSITSTEPLWDAIPSESSPYPHQPSGTTTSSFPPNPTRPTNIPPPSSLLSLLSNIYITLSAHPPTPTQILNLYHATASITAARAHRWRRDTLLAQSTRISAASTSSKGIGGMKLSSLNKGESAREEREAQETVDLWNARVVKWWAIVKEEERVRGKKGGLRLQLPLGVRVVGAREGGMEAGYVCPVCGMKRSERVVGVDEGVEDVFGEFWVEGWGHRACGEMWYEWKGLLGQR